MGVVAFRFFNNRPGEGALRLIPANALLFVSADLTPSASQAIVFKKIDDALARNEIKGIEKGFMDAFDQAKVVPELRELMTRSAAFAMVPPDKADEKGAEPIVIFLSLTDGPRAAQLLAKAGKTQFYKGAQFVTLPKASLGMMVLGDQLVMSPNPKMLYAVKQVAANEMPSVVSTPEYIAARAALDSDANLMLFVNPKALKMIDAKNEGLGKIADAAGLVAVGLSIRDGGISISAHGTVDATKFPAFNAFAQVKPLRSDLYRVLPGGLYGAAAAAQQGSSVEFLMAAMEDLGGAKDIQKLRDELKKNADLDIKDDIVPAIQGNMALGLYPSDGQTVGGLDLLAVVDDQNGADPAKLAEKVRAFLDKAYQDSEKKGPLMVKTDDPDGTTWVLAPDVEQQMQKGLREGMKAPELKGELLSEGKTVLYATRGKTVFLATSKGLLSRAIKAYTTGAGSIAADTGFAATQPVMEGSHSAVVFNLARMASGVEATLNLDKMDPDASKIVKGILDLFKGLDAPFYAKGQVSSSHYSGGLFIPLDYDKLIDFIGQQMKSGK